MAKSASATTGRKDAAGKSTEKKPSSRKQRRQLEESELNGLQSKIDALTGDEKFVKFDELPICNKTKDGLRKANFVEMTEIQKSALPLALRGKDILGAAKTGSGKTLAFLIPILEHLNRQKWTQHDGLGALIISPTRELVLRKVGCAHQLSAGLVIGGKDVKMEQERLSRMNILVATPGRLLQHMDQTVGFDCNNLQLLVLDEADRILDMGFEKTINAIVENLPNERQTLLFSATQTKSIRDLARLSLKDPEYVAVHEKSEHSTPQRLMQSYMVCELPQKLDILFSFIRTHPKSKGLVFLSSCKQVRFVYETFRKMRPGVSLMQLHGKQKQPMRMSIYSDFMKKSAAFLLATDIAARGLDFPAVDWVIQVDVPEDADTYIHRVGRTARYESKGSALMLVLPSEEAGVLEELKRKKVPVNKVDMNPDKLYSVKSMLQDFCAADVELKYLGQKAFVSYMKSVYLQRNKNIFDVTKLPAEAYAASLGLANTPNIKFVQRAKEEKNKSRLGQGKKAQEQQSSSSSKAAADDDDEADIAKYKGMVIGSDDEDEDNDDHGPEEGLTDDEEDNDGDEGGDDEKEGRGEGKRKTRIERMFAKKNLTVLSDHYAKLRNNQDDGDDDGDELMVLARKDHDVDESEPMAPAHLSRRDLLKTKKKYRLKVETPGQKVVFDEEGNAEETFADNPNKDHEQIQFLGSEVARLKAVDPEDKATERSRIRERNLKKKLAAKQAKLSRDQVTVTLGGADDEDDHEEDEEEEEEDDDDDDDDDDEGDYNDDDNDDDEDDDQEERLNYRDTKYSITKNAGRTPFAHKKRGRQADEDEDDHDEDLSLDEAEEKDEAKTRNLKASTKQDQKRIKRDVSFAGQAASPAVSASSAVNTKAKPRTIEEDEALALRLLRQRK